MGATYLLGGDDGQYDDLALFLIADGEYPDLSGAYSFQVKIYDAAGSPVVTKTSGIVGQDPFPDDEIDEPEPNLIVAWEGDLDQLETAGRYTVTYRAIPDGDETPYEMVGELIIRALAPNRGYCEAVDLDFGSVAVKPSFNAYEKINAAADEINGAIGQRYALPLNLAAAPEFVGILLRSVNAQLATGRTLLAAGSSKDSNVHAYGEQLVRDALAQVEAMACGAIQLTGVPKLAGSSKSQAPGIRNRDSVSPMDVFEALVRSEIVPAWEPGV